MNVRKRFELCYNILNEYQFIHKREFLSQYPLVFPSLVQEWVNELEKFSPSELARFETTPWSFDFGDIKSRELFSMIKDVNNVKLKEPNTVKLHPNVLRKLNQKKKHEVEKIVGFYSDYLQEREAHFVDVGSGAGHLSQALVYNSSNTSLCVDMDMRLQEIGRKKILHWLPENADKIIFTKMLFEESSKIKNSSLSHLISLHGCGPLSTSIVKNFHTEGYLSLMNFGCCYHKILDEYNISKLAQKYNLHLGSQSFFLAERKTSLVAAKDIVQRRAVKRYRYALHFFLNDHFNLEFTSIGNASQSDYSGPFSNYAKKFHRASELLDISNEQLDNYIISEEFNSLFNKYFLLDSIRSIFARVIEIYLICDRALYLEELGYDVEVFQLFDASLSPRNLAIFAKS